MTPPRKVLLIVGIILFAINASVTTVAAGAGSQSQILKAVNAIRVHHRLAPLQLHPSLQRAAAEQAKLMARSGKMAHRVRFGQGFKARLRRVGYRGLAAENIAKGQRSLNHVLKAWMNSRGHRRNMLHPRMRYFGLSAAKGGGRNYWAMVLGG
ncbi:MAG: CAP domain-containing protein [Rhizobiaceae bacterium]